jgi:hypothetical protein
VPTLVFMASTTHEVFNGVNQLLVTLEVGLRIQRYCVGWLLGNIVVWATKFGHKLRGCPQTLPLPWRALAHQ